MKFSDLFRINPISLYVNFKLLKFKDAIKMPLWIYGRLSIHSLNGIVKIHGPVQPGMIKIGKSTLGIFENSLSSVLNIQGELNFLGKASIGRGSSISVGQNSKIEFGYNFIITGKSTIISSGNSKVVFGKDNLLSWDILIINNDFHKIYNLENDVINKPKDILIGDNVWIGCRSTILKGAIISSNNVIGANSVVSSQIKYSGAILAGVPVRLIKENIKWEK